MILYKTNHQKHFLLHFNTFLVWNIYLPLEELLSWLQWLLLLRCLGGFILISSFCFWNQSTCLSLGWALFYPCGHIFWLKWQSFFKIQYISMPKWPLGPLTLLFFHNQDNIIILFCGAWCSKQTWCLHMMCGYIIRNSTFMQTSGFVQTGLFKVIKQYSWSLFY